MNEEQAEKETSVKAGRGNIKKNSNLHVDNRKPMKFTERS
jgi:hypothetical protein